LTPARALVAERVRRYWILGIECSLLGIQKLAYFLERSIEKLRLPNPLDLRFQADKYGPYAPRLSRLLDGLDGSNLHCGNASPTQLPSTSSGSKIPSEIKLPPISDRAKQGVPSCTRGEDEID
jgi:hypothetical protein